MKKDSVQISYPPKNRMYLTNGKSSDALTSGESFVFEGAFQKCLDCGLIHPQAPRIVKTLKGVQQLKFSSLEWNSVFPDKRRLVRRGMSRW